ncbi:MAG: helix-turn-helix transcriptional regulator [Bacillota bacterium]|nr:helix-turn-helix transcriptional regulator [Bacillota bacterium]
MTPTLDLLIQFADGMSKQFGQDCEIVIHDLTLQNLEHSIIYIVNGHVTNRKPGDGPSKVVLETLHKDPDSLKDHIGYLTRTSDGRILKSSTMYIRGEDRRIHYIFSLNYDITGLLAVDRAVKQLVESEPQAGNKQPEQILQNVNDLLDNLIEQSVAMIGKPVALMTKDEKVSAIQFLNDAGAFLITKSGDKVSKYFGISKYTLYSYIDVNK